VVAAGVGRRRRGVAGSGSWGGAWGIDLLGAKNELGSRVGTREGGELARERSLHGERGDLTLRSE
jgi:hypothetical protein